MEKFLSSNKSEICLVANRLQLPGSLKSPIKSLEALTSLPARIIHQNELTHLGEYNPKDSRLYNKSTLLALECLYELSLKSILPNYKPERVGLYVVGPWGVLPHDVINNVIHENMAPPEAMRKHFHPKFNLKNLLAILPGHLSIHFNIQGPTHCTPSYNGSPDDAYAALEKAKMDLACDYIDLAVFVGINCFEEATYVFHRMKALPANAVLNEAAVALLLTKDSNFPLRKIISSKHEDYGCLNYLLRDWEFI